VDTLSSASDVETASQKAFKLRGVRLENKFKISGALTIPKNVFNSIPEIEVLCVT